MDHERQQRVQKLAKTVYQEILVTWTAKEKLNGRNVPVPDTESRFLGDVRILFLQKGYECYAIQEGGKWGSTKKFYLEIRPKRPR